jgi:hypothetical protein
MSAEMWDEPFCSQQQRNEIKALVERSGGEEGFLTVQMNDAPFSICFLGE